MSNVRYEFIPNKRYEDGCRTGCIGLLRMNCDEFWSTVLVMRSATPTPFTGNNIFFKSDWGRTGICLCAYKDAIECVERALDRLNPFHEEHRIPLGPDELLEILRS